MIRKDPPLIKIYEAIWCIADNRLEIDKQNSGLFWSEFQTVKAKVYSSSRWKHYEVEYNEEKNAMMANDNGSYWKWYLWYPQIALLIKLWKISVPQQFFQWLKDIMRKDINTKNKNDFDKSMEEINLIMKDRWIIIDDFNNRLYEAYSQIKDMKMGLLWKKILPPKWY